MVSNNMVVVKKALSMFFVVLMVISTISCSVNPVTGEKEINLISDSEEISMGEKDYEPLLQISGGPYEVHPEIVKYVREVGNRIASVSDRELPYEFEVVNSSEVNAWMLPGGKMAITRGLLLKIESEDQLAAVIGHEVVHAAARHGVEKLQSDWFLQAISAGLLVAAGLNIKDEQKREAVVQIGSIGAGVGRLVLEASFSRDEEREADKYGMEYMERAGYNQWGAVELQKILLRERENDPGLLERLLSTHPMSEERIEYTKEIAQKSRVRNEEKKQQYHRRMASLLNDAEAYEYYDKAREMYEQGDEKGSLFMINKAIKMQPKEGVYYLLKGKILAKQNDYEGAVKECERSTLLSKRYYAPYLCVGVLQDKMGNEDDARIALERSVELFATDVALRILGNYAEKEGDYYMAKEYYRRASTSKTEVGKAAFLELLKLDLPDNPGMYVDGCVIRNGDNKPVLKIRNKTPYPLYKIVVKINGEEIEIDGEIPSYESVYKDISDMFVFAENSESKLEKALRMFNICTFRVPVVSAELAN